MALAATGPATGQALYLVFINSPGIHLPSVTFSNGCRVISSARSEANACRLVVASTG